MRSKHKPRKIYIKESFIRLLEGLETNVGDDGKIHASITTSTDDKSNKEVDTRLFGSRNDILYGDGTLSSMSLEEMITAYKFRMDVWNKIYMFIKNNPNIDFSSLDNRYVSRIIGTDVTKLDGKVYNAIMRTLSKDSYEEMLSNALNNYNKGAKEYSFLKDKYDRTFNDGSDFKTSNGDNVKPRYYVGKVPSTNVKVISVFTMNSFDLSDILKHGQVRQSKVTDKMLGISQQDRGKKQYAFPSRRGGIENEKLGVMYDDGVSPSIENNFSYGDDSFDDDGNLSDKDHFGRKSMDGGYTSMSQFIDKSIMGAAFALKNEKVEANFIISAPSSSKFNTYYCTRLSSKIGTEFVNGFFERNVVDAVVDEEQMRKDGIDEVSIQHIKLQIESFAMKEIVGIVTSPIDSYMKENDKLVSLDKKYGIRGRKGKNNILTTNVSSFSTLIKCAILEIIINGGVLKPNDNLGRYIIDQMSVFNDPTRVNANGMSFNSVIKQLSSILDGDESFYACVNQVNSLVNKYSEKLIKGFKPTMLEAKKFKITNFEFKHRQYLKNVYVIANKELNKNYQLLKRYSNAKFLLFDEDINSGATLKILIDAMASHNIKESQITCLVNSYYLNG